MTGIHVAASREYDVLIGGGLIDEAGARLAALGKSGRVMIAAGARVFGLYGARVEASMQRAGFETRRFIYPGGEGCKTLESYAALLSALAEGHFGRTDTLIALGGGVTGDLAGFAAATWQRGMNFVQLPTTLLAAVDSSVGGKTAVNLGTGKNQVGSFYQPCLVLCDPDALKTLDRAELSNGCAEVIKYALLADAGLFARLEAAPDCAGTETVIARCVDIKRALVAADEFDTGRRMLLNLGHSVGHAVEKCSGFTVPHGAGVAIGLCVIARACVRRGLFPAPALSRLERLIESFSLPTTARYSVQELFDAMRADKKIADGRLTLVVPRDIGRCEFMRVGMEDVPKWLEDGGMV